MHLSSPPTKFLPYIFMAHCSRASSPSLRLPPHARVGWSVRRASLISNIKFLPSPLGCRRTCETSAPPIVSTFGATRPSATVPFPSPRFSSQVDKVSPVEDGSAWEPREGNKSNASSKVEELQK